MPNRDVSSDDRDDRICEKFCKFNLYKLEEMGVPCGAMPCADQFYRGRHSYTLCIGKAVSQFGFSSLPLWFGEATYNQYISIWFHLFCLIPYWRGYEDSSTMAHTHACTFTCLGYYCRPWLTYSSIPASTPQAIEVLCKQRAYFVKRVAPGAEGKVGQVSWLKNTDPKEAWRVAQIQAGIEPLSDECFWVSISNGVPNPELTAGGGEVILLPSL